jgi:hypothetical protein
MSVDPPVCYKRNYDYYRRFFQLPTNYYHNTSYYSTIDKDNYYGKPDNQAQLDIKSRKTTALCFLSPTQMKTNALIGPSGAKLTNQQKWALIAKGGTLCCKP